MTKRTVARSVLMLMIPVLLASCGKKEEVTIAADKPLVYLNVENAAASSFDETPDWAPRPDAMAPVDRDMLTRWSSKLGADNEWIYFDFGRPKTVSKIVIKWERAYAVDYEILTSNDAKHWKRFVLMTGQDGVVDEIECAPVEARYVKLVGLKRNQPTWGFSMWELELYGPKSLNPDEKEDTTTIVDMDDKKKEFEAARANIRTKLTPFDPGEFHKGVVYTSWSAEELSDVSSDLTLVHLHDLGVRHIAIMIPAYQEVVDSTEIVTHDIPGGDTPMDKTLIHAITTCHSLGMKVMLKPHVDCLDGTFRGDILASPEWFANYKKIAVRYAKMAQEHKVELYAVGTELENTSFSHWEPQWRDVIDSVKGVYTGHLVYAANWTEYETVPFWDMMDLIGIDAYFPLTDKNDPTQEELVAGWEGVADTIEAWLVKSNLLDKGVIFTELGYVSSDGTAKQPWATLVNAEDQDEQADALDAAFTVLSKRPWFKGIYLWQYFSQKRWSPKGFPVRGKKAEKVLGKWYKEL
jgi:hypothetical protein